MHSFSIKGPATAICYATYSAWPCYLLCNLLSMALLSVMQLTQHGPAICCATYSAWPCYLLCNLLSMALLSVMQLTQHGPAICYATYSAWPCYLLLYIAMKRLLVCSSQMSYISGEKLWCTILLCRTNIFCDKFDATQQTYCKRLRVLCPEHTKEPKVLA